MLTLGFRVQGKLAHSPCREGSDEEGEAGHDEEGDDESACMTNRSVPPPSLRAARLLQACAGNVNVTTL